MQIKSILRSTINQLRSDEAALEAQILLQHVLNVNHAWLIAHADDDISPEQYESFQAVLQRRMNGEPIAYILGEREFYGLKLKTTPNTLIPRPDTEALVDAILEKIAPNDHGSILDLGTGTGAIALAVAKHRPHAAVTAADFSIEALKVAKENATTLNINSVTFIQSDWFDALKKQTFDWIVSNPPYIESDDPHLCQGDLRFEPRTALAAGKDGLDDIRAIISQAKAWLKPNGWLMFEHGYNQAEAVTDLFQQAEFRHISHVKDIAGIDRVTLAQH